MVEEEERRGIVQRHTALHHPGSMRCWCPAQSWDRPSRAAAVAEEEERHLHKRTLEHQKQSKT